MKSLTNRVLLSFGFGMFAIALMVAAMLGQSPPSLAIDGILTDCRVRGVIAGGPSPNPAIFGEREVVVTQLSAEYDQPKAAAECIITGPTWSWSIQKVERQAPGSATWNPHSYRPTREHPNPNAPDSTLRATFPQPGAWRVTLKVTGTWSSTNCLGCSPDPSATVVVETTVSPCSFTGVLTPEDDFMGRSYSRVGLGEEGSLSVRAAAGVDLAALEPLTWRVKSGIEFMTVASSTSDGTATFKAKRNPGRAVLEVSTTRVLCKAELTVDIVAPNDVHHEYIKDEPGVGVAGGKVFYGIIDNVFFRPTDVSYQRLWVGEGPDPIPEVKGAFRDAVGNQPHLANGPIAMTGGNRTKGSRWIVPDWIGVSNVDEGGEPGHFIWDIPQQYFDDAGYRQNIRDLTQRFDFDGKRTIRIQKGGVDKSGPP